MKTAKVSVTAPVYFAAGDWLDGSVLAAPQWVRSGVIEVSAERAADFSANGYADIVSVDGDPVTWGACCGGDHDH